MRRSIFGLVSAMFLIGAHEARAAQCEIPNILILLDISGSMNKGSPTKYSEAIKGIDAAVSAFEDRAKFGLMVFPRPNEGATPYGYCQVSSALAVPFALNNATAIHDYLTPGKGNYFGGPKGTYDTPLYQGLSSAAAAGGFVSGQKNIIMLISDGSQDCCRKNDWNTTADCIPNTTTLESTEAEVNRQAIIGVTSMMTSQGITLYPVGFSADSDASLLNRVAEAAGTKRDPNCDASGTVPGAPDACYYPANNGTALATQLGQIVQQVGQEVCDGIDNDCDGQVDNVPGTTDKLSKPCGNDCGEGTQICITPAGGGYEKWSPCDAPLPEKEICDGLDNDCDGSTDEDQRMDCSNCKGAGAIECVNGELTECNAPQVLSIDDCTPVKPLAEEPKIAPLDKKRGNIIDGCGCGAAGLSGSGWFAFAAVLFVLARRRRSA